MRSVPISDDDGDVFDPPLPPNVAKVTHLAPSAHGQRRQADETVLYIFDESTHPRIYQEIIKEIHKTFARKPSETSDRDELRHELIDMVRTTGGKFVTPTDEWHELSLDETKERVWDFLHQRCFVKMNSAKDVVMHGKKVSRSAGYLGFLRVRDELGSIYVEATDDETKRDIAESLVETIYFEGGQFVWQFIGADSAQYFIMTDLKASNRAEQALRRYRPIVRRAIDLSLSSLGQAFMSMRVSEDTDAAVSERVGTVYFQSAADSGGDGTLFDTVALLDASTATLGDRSTVIGATIPDCCTVHDPLMVPTSSDGSTDGVQDPAQQGSQECSTNDEREHTMDQTDSRMSAGSHSSPDMALFLPNPNGPRSSETFVGNAVDTAGKSSEKSVEFDTTTSTTSVESVDTYPSHAEFDADLFNDFGFDDCVWPERIQVEPADRSMFDHPAHVIKITHHGPSSIDNTLTATEGRVLYLDKGSTADHKFKDLFRKTHVRFALARTNYSDQQKIHKVLINTICNELGGTFLTDDFHPMPYHETEQYVWEFLEQKCYMTLDPYTDVVTVRGGGAQHYYRICHTPLPPADRSSELRVRGTNRRQTCLPVNSSAATPINYDLHSASNQERREESFMSTSGVSELTGAGSMLFDASVVFDASLATLDERPTATETVSSGGIAAYDPHAVAVSQEFARLFSAGDYDGVNALVQQAFRERNANNERMMDQSRSSTGGSHLSPDTASQRANATVAPGVILYVHKGTATDRIYKDLFRKAHIRFAGANSSDQSKIHKVLINKVCSEMGGTFLTDEFHPMPYRETEQSVRDFLEQKCYTDFNRDTDVLAGRGGAAQNYVGRQRYLQACLDHSAHYKDKATCGLIKDNITEYIVETAKQTGRFLVKEVQGGATAYYIMDHKSALKKTKQALRDARPRQT